MSFLKRLAVCCSILTVFIAGCQGKQQSQSEQGKALAKVNGVPITSADLEYRPKVGHANPVILRKKSLDDVIVDELFYQKGIKLGLDKDPGYRRMLVKLEQQPPEAKRLEMRRRVINTQIASNLEVKPLEIQEYYDKNANWIETDLHLLMIKNDSKEEVEKALTKISGGESFESVARPLMGNATTDDREPWDLGFVKWDKIPVDFVDNIYKLRPGEVSGILGSQQAGFQVVKLIERRKGQKVGISSIHAILMNRLRDLKMLEAYNQYVEQLKKDAKIEKY